MKKSSVILCIIIGFTLFVSLKTLTSQPRYFFDEAVVVETAHNFANFGTLDIMTSPGVLSGYKHLFNSTGYTVSLPLALIFKLSPVSLVSGRMMMVVWLVIAILSIWYVVRKFWGEEAALLSSALIASFAPFYGNGMQIMGEVPGFVFLIWGLYQLILKKNFKIAGLFIGLAAITKLSIYDLVLISFPIYLFFFETNRIKKLWDFIVGCIGPGILFLFLIMPNVFSVKYYLEVINLYRNPYDSPSLLNNFISNIQTYWHHTTIVYLGILLVIIAFTLIRKTEPLEQNVRRLYGLVFIYMAFLVFYFLRSPGWFRYIFPLELLALIIIYPILSLKKRELATIVCCGLIILNLGQLFLFRGDVKDTSPQDTAAYITNLDQSVGIINATEVSSLIPEDKRYQVVNYFGVPELGSNPLLVDNVSRTKIIVFKSADNPLVLPYQKTLETYYEPINKIGSYRIYKLKK